MVLAALAQTPECGTLTRTRLHVWAFMKCIHLRHTERGSLLHHPRDLNSNSIGIAGVKISAIRWKEKSESVWNAGVIILLTLRR
jgi:hypothetical protein